MTLSNRQNNLQERVQLLALISLALGLLALWIYFVGYGRFHIDEGMHINAGRMLFEEGRWLDRDFPFSQGPGGPYLNGATDAIRYREVWLNPGARIVDQLGEIRVEMHRLAPNHCSMLNFETHIAVETRCDIFPGLEYSFFSYVPELNSREATANHILNQELLVRNLRNAPPEFVVLNRRAVNWIRSEERLIKGALRLGAMMGRDTLLEEMEVPVGPSHSFWIDVFFDVRNDLLPAGSRRTAQERVPARRRRGRGE